MEGSGLVRVQSHTYDMHQWPAFEEGRARENILRWEDEGELDYRAALTGVGPATKERILAEADKHLTAWELERLVRIAYPDQA